MPDEATKDEKPEDASTTGGQAPPKPAEEQPGPPPRAAEAEGDGEEEQAGDEDLASPEAVARRVAALGEEDEVERLARQEEAKLAERRRAGKKKKKGGLEAAASKRLSKIGAKAPVRRALPTVAEADPLIDRAAKLSDWAKKNQNVVGTVVGAIVLGLAGVGVYTYMERKKDAQASTELAKALDDEHGRIGDPDKDDEEGKVHDPRPIFKTIADRREAALAKYREVESKYKGTGAAILARLAEGSILLDKHDVAGAKAAFDEVGESALGKVDPQVKGRAQEGVGFALELRAADQKGDEKRATLEEAAKAFHEMESVDVMGFQELAMYHQARVAEETGDRAKAIELLKKLHERVTKPGENHPFVYLEHVADDRLRALDPTALPPKAPGQLGGPGQNQLTQAQMRRMIEQAQKAAQKQGQNPGGAPPAPAPSEPEDLPP